MHKYFPMLSWIKSYSSVELRSDLMAGLTVGVMLVPQGMAYAMIAGLPPIFGLYASIVPLVIYAVMGTSRQLAVGPVAMVSLLTAASVGVLAAEGSARYIELAILLAFLVGSLRVMLGLFKMGFLVSFLSVPVIRGYTYAAALIIGLSQLKHLLGLDTPNSQYIHRTLAYTFEHIAHINIMTVVIGLGGIVVLVGTKRFIPKVPGPLVVVVLAIIAVTFLQLERHGVSVVGAVPEGLPDFSFPIFNMDDILSLIPAAIVITLVSFMESIAIAKTVQAKHKNYKIDPNQELVALGMSSLIGSFFQSYPTTGGFSRTAVNDDAGAQTGLAGVFSAILIGLTLLFLTPLFYNLPNAVLASIIMVAVFKLIQVDKAIELWKSSKSEFAMMAVTFVATLSLGIAQGIGAGVLLSLGMIIYQSSKPHMAVLGNIPRTDFYRNISRFNNLSEYPDKLIVRLDAQLFFANAEYFVTSLQELIEARATTLKYVIINAECINNMDLSAALLLSEFVSEQRKEGREVLFAGVIGPVRDRMKRYGLFEQLGVDHFFICVQDAVNYTEGETADAGRTVHSAYVSQSKG